jgi:hypothetical protein
MPMDAVELQICRCWCNQRLGGRTHLRRNGDGLTLPALATPMLQWVARTCDLGHGVAAKDSHLANVSRLLATAS